MMMLKERFRKAWTFPGKQKIHCIIPASESQVQTKVFSEANVFRNIHTVLLQDEECQVEDIRGFVSCKYDRKWWLVCVCYKWMTVKFNVFASLWHQQIFHISFTAMNFVGSTVKRNPVASLRN
jgi:hypothetical protein